MAEQLESLKYTFREHGREAVVAQLGSCAQKVLRATAKAAGLAQQVSGRSLTTEELRQNLLEHALASTQVGVGWLGFFLLVSLNTNAVRQVTRINVFFVCVCQDLTKWIALCSPCQAAPSQSAGMKKLQQLKEILVEEGRERVTSRRPAKRYARSLQSGAVVGGHADWTDICGGWTTIRRIGAPAQPIGWARRGGLCWILI